MFSLYIMSHMSLKDLLLPLLTDKNKHGNVTNKSKLHALVYYYLVQLGFVALHSSYIKRFMSAISYDKIIWPHMN